MLKIWIKNIKSSLESDSRHIAMFRGMLLYAIFGIFLLAIVGIFFSDSTSKFVRYLPFACILAAITISIQLSLFPLKNKNLINFSCLLVLAIYLIGGGLNAYIDAKIYDGPQYDGAFQLFFPLKRMEDGQWPGKDFFYFHGQLIPVLVYPIFKFLGGDFFASQLASKIIDLIIPFAYFIIFRQLGLSRERSLIASVLLIGLLVTDRFTFGTQNPIDGVHIYSLRSLIPLLYLAYISKKLADEAYLENFNKEFYTKTVFIQAFIFTISFYFGSEQAFYLLAAIMLANLIAIGLKPWRIIFSKILLLLLSISLLLLSNELIFLSQKPLLYLGEISKNQTWFYASYPNEFLHSILDFSRYRSSSYKVSAKLIVCLAGIPTLLGLTWFLMPREEKRLFFFSLIGGAYGLIGLTSFIASYSGEQYTDNAIKVFLIACIILLIKLSFKESRSIPQSPKIYRIPRDLIAATPVVLTFSVIACSYTTFTALHISTNYRLQKIVDSGLFMSLQDLGIKLPFESLNIKGNERYHASQFLALEQAQGNESAKIFYPEWTFIDGFNEGSKQLYKIPLAQEIPKSLGIGDFCSINDTEYSIEDIDKESNYLYFSLNSPLKSPERTLPTSINCYRKSSENYITFNESPLHLEQNMFDHFFYDGVFRGKKLQIKIKDSERSRIRVGDQVIFAKRAYEITELYSNGVITLNLNAYPLPYDFDQKATFSVIQKISPFNSFKKSLKTLQKPEVITRIFFNDIEKLKDINTHNKIFTLNTNETANVLAVDFSKAIIEINGYISPSELRYGFHLGLLEKSNLNSFNRTTPVFQLMKGILSANSSSPHITGSNIDFLFHTFSSALLKEYMDGLIQLSPDLISVPSGRYVNNFSWYDNWLIRGRWPVYEYLLKSYDPVAESKFESFWKKGELFSESDAWKTLNISHEKSQQTLLLSSPSSNLNDECNVKAFEVEFDYTVSGWQRVLPLLGGSARHIALIDDLLAVPLTFNPNEKTVRFPVFTEKNNVQIIAKTLSPFGIGTSIEILGARYRQLHLPRNRTAAIVGKSASSICM